MASARLAVLSQLEYRVNFAIDAVIQPICTTAIEVTLWMAILSGMGRENLGGFGREYYLAYALWANFVGRCTANWMYEFQMVDEIDTGRINSVLVRPISFYEFFLSQFLGYKSVILAISFIFPLIACFLLNAPLIPERLPLMVAMILTYLVFTYTISFCVACSAFYLNRAHALTGMKNLALWVLTGEIVPLDLFPEPLRSVMMNSPFACGVYVPVAFLTGRIGPAHFQTAFLSLLAGIVVAGLLARLMWRWGIRQYTGTGA